MLKFHVEPTVGRGEKLGPFFLPTTASEITLRKYVDFKLMMNSQPEWFIQFQQMVQSEAEEAISKWDASRWIEYYNILASVVSFFCGADPKVLLRLESSVGKKDVGASASLQVMYNTVLGTILGYQPKTIRRFTYKKETYQLPKPKKGSATNVSGERLKVIEVITAFQAEKIYTSKDENGNFILGDYEFNVDIAVVAAICRKLEKGKPEDIPLEDNDWDIFFQERCKHFEDVPFTIAKDVFFFIRNSKGMWKDTLSYLLLSKIIRP